MTELVNLLGDGISHRRLETELVSLLRDRVDRRLETELLLGNGNGSWRLL